jgi:hypothetical protein
MTQVSARWAGALAVCLLGGCAAQPAARSTSARAQPTAIAAPSEGAGVPAPIQSLPSAVGVGQAERELSERLRALFPDLQGFEVTVETGMHQTDIRDADMDAAETFAVTVSEDKTARVWALENGKESAVLRFPGPGMRGALEAVAVNPTGTQVALGGYEGSIYLFDSSNWRLVRTIAPGRGTIHQLRYSRDGKRLAVGFHGSHGLSVYETQGYTPVFDAVDFDGDIYGLAFNSSGQLAVSAWDRTVRLYSEKYRRIAEQEFSSRPYRVAFDPSGKHLVVGFIDGAVARVLTVPTLRTERELEPPVPSNTSSLGTVTFSRDGREVLASGRYKVAGRNPVLRWKADYTPLESWFLHRNTPERLLALKGGQLLLASQDPLVAVLQPSGEVKWLNANTTPDFGESPLANFQASPDASVVEFAWGRGDEARVAFDVRRLAVLAANQPRALMHAVTESPHLKVDNWKDAPDPSVGGHRLDVERFEVCRALSIAIDGRFLLGCEWNVYLFDALGNRIWRQGTTGSTRGAYLTADARLAAVALDDGTIRWFSGSTGAELVAVAFGGASHEWVAWTPQGFYFGTPLGEHTVGLDMLHKDGFAEFEPLENFADLMRRPDVLKQAIDKLEVDSVGSHVALAQPAR